MATTYAQFISRLRSDMADFPIKRYETASGDGTTTIFNLQNPKILENTTVVTVGGVTKTSGTHYNIDANVGQLVFTNGNAPAAPASGSQDNITISYSSVNETDADWISITNEILGLLRRKFWIEFVDESTLESVSDQNDYSTTTVAADIIHLLDFEYKVSDTAPWQSIRSFTNAVFYKDLQKIHIRPAFSASGYNLRIRGNRAYVKGSTTSSNFEPQEKYWPAIQKLAGATYLDRRATEMSKQLGAVSKEKAFESMADMIKLALSWRNSGMALVKELKPSRPAKVIPFSIMKLTI